jgi:hypothetical protein
MGESFFRHQYTSHKYCDMCHGAFKQMYEGVEIGGFRYKFHSTDEILAAKKNYEDKKAQGIEFNPNLTPLDNSENDAIIEEDNIEK